MDRLLSATDVPGKVKIEESLSCCLFSPSFFCTVFGENINMFNTNKLSKYCMVSINQYKKQFLHVNCSILQYGCLNKINTTLCLFCNRKKVIAKLTYRYLTFLQGFLFYKRWQKAFLPSGRALGPFRKRNSPSFVLHVFGQVQSFLSCSEEKKFFQKQ